MPLPRDGAGLPENLRTVLHAGLDTMGPYHSFGSTMLHVALSRASTVSPSRKESAPARSAATALMGQVLASSRGTRSTNCHARLPELLWLAFLGVTLHRVTDTSPDHRRTRQLVDGLAPIIDRAVAREPAAVGRRLAADVFTLVDQLATPTTDRNDP